MSIRDRVPYFQLSRRQFLGASVVTATLTAADSFAAEPDPKCPRCGGLGRIPLLGEKPFVWLKGTPLPKLDSFVDEQSCPICQPPSDKSELIAEFKAKIDGAVEANKK